jgi:hypothetical protein
MIPCEYDGRRFGIGHEPCQRTDTAQYNAGCYGSAWLCPDHRRTATLLCDEANAAERDNGLALAQIFSDERQMMGIKK